MTAVLPSTGNAFVEALLRSPTFLPQLAALSVPVLAMTVAFGGLLVMRRRRAGARPLARLHRETEGVALAADLVLVMAPFMVLVMVLLQTTWMMRETVLVHYAAYTAARSARAHACPPLPENGQVFLLERLGRLGCTNDWNRAETAARYSLISASPAWGIPCQGACRIPEQVLSAISGPTGVSAQLPALLDQARYAFDGDNVRLDVGFDPKYLLIGARRGSVPPIRARVTFRHYVLYGLGPAIGTRRPDGYFYRESEAEVTLL